MSEVLIKWEKPQTIKRLWEKDPTLWTNKGEEKWLGWLDVVAGQNARIDELLKIQTHFKKFKQVALLGMGGSSLCPEVLAKTFGHKEGFPTLSVLDSTDPDQVLAFDKSLDIKNTCFIVSSKSGSTLEPNIFLEYFYARGKDVLGSHCGEHFMAITDPNSNMEKKAKELKFHRIFHGNPSIGGRFSALSDFGIIPALAIGLDIRKYLSHTAKMVEACKAGSHNPGVELGIALGQSALEGYDKISLIASPELSHLPGWIEQLVAESTGKEGKGLIPLVENRINAPDEYGQDRHFVYLKYEKSAENLDQDISRLKEAAMPVTVVTIHDLYDLGQEFFRWEIATSVVGAILKVNPFDQPDVEASKIETKRLTNAFEESGALPASQAFYSDSQFEVYTDERNTKEFQNQKSLADILSTHFKRLNPNDYVALLSYIEMNPTTEKALGTIKHLIQKSSRAAVCVGFGPRFLHSTGQAYKGGPNTGVFLQIIGQPKHDLPIPNHKFTFGLVERTQALGDFQVLCDRERRVLQLQIKGDLIEGLEKLTTLVVAR